MVTFKGHNTITDLPDELLLQIFESLYSDCQVLKYLPLNNSRFRIFDVLSRANRRLRSLVLPFLWRDIACNSVGRLDFLTDKKLYYDWEADVAEVATDEKEMFRRWRSSLVRTIRIGRPAYPWYSHTGFNNNSGGHMSYHNYGDPLPFPKLVSFDYAQSVASPSLIDSLEHCRELRNMVLAWSDHLSFPNMQRFPQIETLRLYLSREADIDFLSTDEHGFITPKVHPFNNIPVFTTITTLSLHECCDFSEVVPQCMRLTFANLRVLRMEQVSADVSLVYDFIQRHSTILEANFYFTEGDDEALRLEALMKLIDGTGTWIGPKGDSDILVDQATLLDMDDDDPYPPTFEPECGPFFRFAFLRRPLSADATKWRSSLGSAQPRYECTGFAIYITEDDLVYGTLDDLIGCLTTRMPHLQELQVASKVIPSDIQNFQWLMDGISCTLHDCRRTLRKFKFHTPLPTPLRRWEHVKWWFGAEEPDDDDPDSDRLRIEYCTEMLVPFLDEPNPPLYSNCRPATLRTLSKDGVYSDYDLERLKGGICFALCLDEDVELDRDDPLLLMNAWEAHNYRRVARIVRQFATVECPSLEELDWYVFDEDEQSVLWAWKILRREDGSVRMVHGKLTWSGCLQGHPPPFPVLVGQELEYARGDAGGEYWWW